MKKKSKSKSTESIEAADWNEIQQVLRESHRIWSSGLDKSRYYHLTWWLMHHPWSRRNYRYLVYKRNKRLVVSSCKLYTLALVRRHRRYRMAGIGAVYTPDRYRGYGYASRFLKNIISMCRREGYDGLLLHSDIGLDFYGRLGFEPLGGRDFHVFLQEQDMEQQILSLPGFVEDVEGEDYDVEPLDPRLSISLVRHYRRWVQNADYGFERDELYWSYKIARENYLRTHTQGFWPQIEIIAGPNGAADGAYALVERNEKILRILEVIGQPEKQEKLWRHILRLALLWRVSLIRGWEGTAPRFLRNVRFIDRDWGVPMMLAFNREIDSWQKSHPCPLLELDHF